jgi:small subunit ribosomal protein S16
MAVKIRLARRGAKKRPYYKVVVADARSPRDGRFLQVVGSYNPLLQDQDPKRVILDHTSIEVWTKKGAQLTSAVARLVRKSQVGK